MGCPTECEGAGCGDLFPAADLTVWSGATLPVGEVAPTDGEDNLLGDADDGPARALVAGGGALWVGVPGVDQVRVYGPGGLGAADSALATLDGATDGEELGATLVRGAGHVLIGAPGRATADGGGDAGAVYAFSGSDLPTGLGGAEVVVSGTRALDRLGDSLALCGDLDGDLVSDWAAGAPGVDAEDAPLGGATYVWASATAPVGEAAADALTTLVRPGDNGARYGDALWCADSLDDDADADLLVGAPYADEPDLPGVGVVQLWLGGDAFGESPALTIVGQEAGEWFGAALAFAQLDGDGVPELVVGAPGRSLDASVGDDLGGAVYVFDGVRIRDAVASAAGETTQLTPDRALLGVYARGRLGTTIVAADFDGDGLDELVVGAPGHNPTGEDRTLQSGGVYLFQGPWTDWPDAQRLTGADTTWVEERLYLRTGETMAAGDVDGDGVPDLVLATRSSGG